MFLLTRDEEELDGIGSLFGTGLRAWKTVLLDPNLPHYFVRFSTKNGDDWQSNTFFVASEVELAGFCYSVANDDALRIDEIMQLVRGTSNAQQFWQLSKIGEIWEGEEPLECETGGTTVLLLDSNGKSIGSDSRSLEEIRIRGKCFSINESCLTVTTSL